VTNASGALNPAYRPGDVVLIEDHINLTGFNPLVGPNDDEIGVRFPDMSQVYWPPFRALAKGVAMQRGYPLQSGVYAGVLGPSLETPAERRLLRLAGADLVGMSTVYEVLAAGHCGMKVLAFAAVTNMALGVSSEPPDTIEQVLANAEAAALPMTRLLTALIAEIDSALTPDQHT
jgi:purine-nucleoside phosphorylase